MCLFLPFFVALPLPVVLGALQPGGGCEAHLCTLVLGDQVLPTPLDLLQGCCQGLLGGRAHELVTVARRAAVLPTQ